MFPQLFNFLTTWFNKKIDIFRKLRTNHFQAVFIVMFIDIPSFIIYLTYYSKREMIVLCYRPSYLCNMTADGQCSCDGLGVSVVIGITYGVDFGVSSYLWSGYLCAGWSCRSVGCKRLFCTFNTHTVQICCLEGTFCKTRRCHVHF